MTTSAFMDDSFYKSFHEMQNEAETLENVEEANMEFLKNFNTPFTGVLGSNPILNANANLLPTQADQRRDIATSVDYRLGNGLGVAKPYRKPDSLLGAGANDDEGFYGRVAPTKMFGRDSKAYDLNFVRDELDERARAGLKKMGFKDDESPDFSNYKEWVWNNLDAVGSGGAPIGNPNQYNRNYPLPDADIAARRLYQPAPSRQTKMMGITGLQEAAMRPNRTMYDPLKVVSEDRQRSMLFRIPRNADVVESVQYESGQVPRGMAGPVEAMPVYGDVDVLRQPVGTNDTASRAVFDRWTNPHSENNNPLIASEMEDKLVRARHQVKYVEGKSLDDADRAFKHRKSISEQPVPDYWRISENQFKSRE